MRIGRGDALNHLLFKRGNPIDLLNEIPTGETMEDRGRGERNDPMGEVAGGTTDVHPVTRIVIPLVMIVTHPGIKTVTVAIDLEIVTEILAIVATDLEMVMAILVTVETTVTVVIGTRTGSGEREKLTDIVDLIDTRRREGLIAHLGGMRVRVGDGGLRNVACLPLVPGVWILHLNAGEGLIMTLLLDHRVNHGGTREEEGKKGRNGNKLLVDDKYCLSILIFDSFFKKKEKLNRLKLYKAGGGGCYENN